MPKKPKGYGKVGRPTMKDVKALKHAQALIKYKTGKEAYKATHNCNDASANKQSHRLITPEVLACMKTLLQLEHNIPIDKDHIVKLLMMVVARWMQGTEKTADMLRAVESLKQLAPEFVDRKVLNDYEKMSGDELDKEIKRLLGSGYETRDN